jgi:hypothetical protein
MIDDPLPLADRSSSSSDAIDALKHAYAAQERVALLIAGRLDLL